MFSFRRRRLYAFALFILIIGLIFLCFQFFSIRVLHSYSGAGEGMEHRLGRGAMPRISNLDVQKFLRNSGKGKQSERPIEKLAERDIITPAACTSNCSDAQDLPVKRLNASSKSRLIVDGKKFKLSADNDQIKLPGIPTTFDSWDSLEKYYASTQVKGAASGLSPNVLSYRGVPTWWRQLYEPTIKGSSDFTCLFSREIIPINRVNDDYCDCKDSTDEPGTSACPDSRFYCLFQSSSKSKWLRPSRVNDGLCDCCDGSDEWMGTLVPERNHIADSRSHYGLYQAPCVDRCSELRAAEANVVELRHKGALLKQNYIKEGSKQHNPNMLYGMDAEFYPLSQKCWSLTISKYIYSVCPFGPIKQKDGGSELVIGQVASWSAYEQGVDLRLSVDNGDGINCPDRKKRSTIIIFRCGLEDKVDSLSESETCVYTVYFSSPAAC